VSRSRPGSGAGLATVFGTLSLVNAGRLARLDAQGQPAAKPLASAVSQVLDGPGRGSAAGKAGLQRVVSRRQGASAAVDHHNGDPLLDSDWPQPGNLTWGDVVLIEVALRNDRPDPVLFSPGQLRLKLLPWNHSSPPGLRPGPRRPCRRRHRTGLDQLPGPADSVAMEIEYFGLEDDAAHALALPLLTVAQVRS
jgi:hypothetical protein